VSFSPVVVLSTGYSKIRFFSVEQGESPSMLTLVLGLVSAALLVIVAGYVLYCKRRVSRYESKDIESSEHKEEEVAQKEDLMIFQGGEDLTICDILDAPGEVIGKSNYGTLYKALLQRSNKVRLLRFLRPVCTARGEELDEMIQFLGRIRHPNLVPLLGFYTGPRGEKLLVHPFYRHGNLTQFIRGNRLFSCLLYFLFCYLVLQEICVSSFSWDAHLVFCPDFVNIIMGLKKACGKS